MAEDPHTRNSAAAGRPPLVEQFGGLAAVFQSDASRQLLEMVKRVARYPSTVLLTGESGTGKEIFARALHHYSLRSNGPWIDVNCGALPEHLVESELFGYEKGAFSGADAAKPGFFEMAHGGTLLLDEIGELDMRMQVKLLRVLDGAPYYRLGGSHKLEVDVRVVAATNRDLEAEVKAGRFRQDLYYRLSQVQLLIPPLRERPDDVRALVRHFLDGFAPEVSLAPETMRLLCGYGWPGNIRELRNVITQAVQVKMANGRSVILPADLPPSLLVPAMEGDVQRGGDLHKMQRLMIERAMQDGGDQAAIATRLGISRRTLSRRLREYGMAARKVRRPLGYLDSTRYHYYRADVDLPLVVDAGGTRLTGRVINLSRTGAGLAEITEPARWSGVFDFDFTLPDGAPVRGRGRLVWSDAQRRGGLHFVNLDPASHAALDRWLEASEQQEGWAELSTAAIGANAD